MITAICNIYINNDLKLRLFKETFPSVYGITDNWLIYIRGKKSKDVIDYIKNNFVDYLDKCIFFDNLYEDNWIKSTLEMLKKSKYDYIYLYREDHFLVNTLDCFKIIINEVFENNIDFISYSFYNLGIPTYSIEALYPEEYQNIYKLNINKNHIKKLMSEYKSFFPFSLVSIIRKEMFLKLLKNENSLISILMPKTIQLIVSYILIPLERLLKGFSIGLFRCKLNTLFKYIGIRFILFPLGTPFNLEKTIQEFELYPYKIGILKKELFANRDDDNGLSNSSLIKRGLYPKTFVYDNFQKDVSFDKEYFSSVNLKKLQKKYCIYYMSTGRTMIPLKKLIIIKGSIKINSDNGDEIILKSGENICIHPNIKHCLTALEDSVFEYSIINIKHNITH